MVIPFWRKTCAQEKRGGCDMHVNVRKSVAICSCLSWLQGNAIPNWQPWPGFCVKTGYRLTPQGHIMNVINFGRCGWLKESLITWCFVIPIVSHCHCMKYHIEIVWNITLKVYFTTMAIYKDVPILTPGRVSVSSVLGQNWWFLILVILLGRWKIPHVE